MFQGSSAPETTVGSLPDLEVRGNIVLLNQILSEAPSNILHTLVLIGEP